MAPKVAEKPATDAKKSPTVRVAKQILGYLDRLEAPKHLTALLDAADVANDGSKRIPVTRKDLDALVAIATAMREQGNVTRGDSRPANPYPVDRGPHGQRRLTAFGPLGCTPLP